MIKNGLYLCKETYNAIKEYSTLIMDEKEISVDEIDIYIDDNIPDNYLIFIKNNNIVTIRKFVKVYHHD